MACAAQRIFLGRGGSVAPAAAIAEPVDVLHEAPHLGLAFRRGRLGQDAIQSLLLPPLQRARVDVRRLGHHAAARRQEAAQLPFPFACWQRRAGGDAKALHRSVGGGPQLFDVHG